jgi:hypothetical protein
MSARRCRWWPGYVLESGNAIVHANEPELANNKQVQAAYLGIRASGLPQAYAPEHKAGFRISRGQQSRSGDQL